MHVQIHVFFIFNMPTTTTVGREHYTFWLSVRQSVRPSVVCLLTPTSRDAIFPYLVKGFERNLTQLFFIMWVGSAVKVFKFWGPIFKKS